MSENNFFEGEDFEQDSGVSGVMGKIGLGLLHFTKITFLVYSGYHGISATLANAGTNEIAKVAQVVGIVTLELTLLGLYISYHNQKITGSAQLLAAVGTYLIGFVMACLGIVADSQLHAGYDMSGWLLAYMQWVLPLSPAIMAFGAGLTHELSPEQKAKRAEARNKADIITINSASRLAMKKAELHRSQQRASMILGAQLSAIEQERAWYNTDTAQRAITAAAMRGAPATLKAAGFDIDVTDLLPANATAEEAAAVKVAPAPMPINRPVMIRPVQPAPAEEVAAEVVAPANNPPTLSNGVIKNGFDNINGTHPKA